ncbi:MAG: hypothetical protein A2633_02825 [Candidatus Sungbacteria bacterium RIFCSPHIGHO2_01_FULL_47_32]|uniref:nicotinamidase n=1 Tax=Candidatus Sungbacteria bacterium RIFCSPHIGHO2_01_FULL_47_32 TaxID=1802264 RepID=A0A1G2K4J3_9BACT|nr:MAG: hypothetical protein A2633_02825 [Candidatus Sungbacteria bacterium RIFCSPHIGHO2_01_FULL_47_32]
MGLASKRRDRWAPLIVDPENDFCPGGSLAVTDGDKVMEPLNIIIMKAVREGRPVIVSRDWHRPDLDQPHFQKWPPHCIQNTFGAEFHRNLFLPANAIIISKGMGDADAYSAFDGVTADGTPLDTVLKSLGVDTLKIGGLATDYCVSATVLNAIKLGYETHFLLYASRGVVKETTDAALDKMWKSGAVFSYAPYNFELVG